MKKIIFLAVAVIGMMLLSGIASAQGGRPLWLAGKRVAVCADRSYSGVVATTENALRQSYGTVIISADCNYGGNAIANAEYIAVLEVVQSYPEARIWLKIIGDRNQIGAIGYGESGSGYIAGFIQNSNSYFGASIGGNNNDEYERLNSAAVEAVEDLH